MTGKNAIATMKKIKKIEKNPEDNIIFALTRAISMEEDYYSEQLIAFPTSNDGCRYRRWKSYQLL